MILIILIMNNHLKIIPKNFVPFEKLLIKPSIPVKKVVMASWSNGKFIFTNEFCDSISCMSGNFKNCSLQHQCLVRPDLDTSLCSNKTKTQECATSNETSAEETFVEAKEQFDSDFDFNSVKTDDAPVNHDEKSDCATDDNISISSNESYENETDNMSVYLDKLAYENPDFHKISLYLNDNSTLLEIETTKSTWSKFFETIQKTESDGIIGYCHNIGIRWRDLASLDGQEWLNDVIINSFMMLLQHKCKSQDISIDVIDVHWLSQYKVRIFE